MGDTKLTRKKKTRNEIKGKGKNEKDIKRKKGEKG